MPSRTVTVGSCAGLHARPATVFVQAAEATGLEVKIAKTGHPAKDATSLLEVLCLGARQGEQVLLIAEGDGAEQALDSLAELLSRDLDAPT